MRGRGRSSVKVTQYMSTRSICQIGGLTRETGKEVTSWTARCTRQSAGMRSGTSTGKTRYTNHNRRELRREPASGTMQFSFGTHSRGRGALELKSSFHIHPSAQSYDHGYLHDTSAAARRNPMQPAAGKASRLGLHDDSKRRQVGDRVLADRKVGCRTFPLNQPSPRRERRAAERSHWSTSRIGVCSLEPGQGGRTAARPQSPSCPVTNDKRLPSGGAGLSLPHPAVRRAAVNVPVTGHPSADRSAGELLPSFQAGGISIRSPRCEITVGPA